MHVEAASTQAAPQRTDPPAPPPAAGAPSPSPSPAELQAAADRVQAAKGDDAKVRALAHELAPLDREARAQLMSILAEREHVGSFTGASDWLNVEHITGMVADGTLSRSDQGLIAEAFAAAANRGLVDHAAQSDFLRTDVPYTEYYANVNRVSGFLRSGGGPEMDRFLGAYAQRELEIAIDSGNALSNPRAETAIHLLHGAGSTALTVQVLDRLGPERRAEVYELLSHAPTSDPRDGRYLDGWGSSDDALALVAEAIGRQPGQGETLYVPGVPYPVGTEGQVTASDRLALEMVRWFGAHRDQVFHGDRADPARAEAMNRLLTGHTQYLLDTLTTPTTGSVQRDGEALAANVDDVQALATLVRAAMLTEEVPAWRQQQAKDELLAYARHLVASHPGEPGQWSPGEHLGLLLASMQGAVAQGYRDLEGQRAGREAVVGFFTDLLVDQATDAAGKITLPSRLVTMLGGAAIDAAGDAGKDALRGAIADFLFGKYDTEGLDGLQQAMNELTDAFVVSLDPALMSVVRTAMHDAREGLNAVE